MAIPNFLFVPSKVERGRKFKGFCYLVKGGYEYTRGYHGSGVDPYQCTEYSRIWDPVEKMFNFVNSKFIVETDVSPDKLENDKLNYIETIINDTFKWCSTKVFSKSEATSFARVCLYKNYSEFGEYIDKLLPDDIDVVEEVEKALRTAMNLKTKPCYMYGKMCPGGKPYSKSVVVKKAYQMLMYHHVTDLPGFIEAWTFSLNLLGLSKYNHIQAKND